MNWQPNDKQKQVLELLGKSTEPMTLREISNQLGYEVKTGTTNTLITKGLMVAVDTEINCNIVIADTGEIIGHTKKKVKAYSLAKGE